MNECDCDMKNVVMPPWMWGYTLTKHMHRHDCAVFKKGSILNTYEHQ